MSGAEAKGTPTPPAGAAAKEEETPTIKRLPQPHRLCVPAKKPTHQPLLNYDVDSDDGFPQTSSSSKQKLRVPPSSSASHALLKDGFDIDLEADSDDSDPDLDLLPPRPVESRPWLMDALPSLPLCTRSALCLPDRSQRKRAQSSPQSNNYTLCSLM